LVTLDGTMEKKLTPVMGFMNNKNLLSEQT